MDTLELELTGPLDLARTVSLLRRGSGDPSMRFVDGAFWWACRTPEGAGTVRVTVRSGAVSRVAATAWGDGAGWLLAAVPGLVGADDDWTGLDLSASKVLTDVRHHLPGVRMTRTGRVMDSLVAACLEQRVTGTEARRAWRMLAWQYGDPAPGPDEPKLRLSPTPATLLEVPSWDWHRYRVDAQRYRTIRAAATVANRLEECVTIAQTDGMAAARKRLRAVPGVGEWTVAETTLRALGDRDAVSVGDFHVANRVGFALTGAARTTDETMLELLAPWAGHRARVVRLIELSGLVPPKYGPRFSPNDISRI